MIPSLSLVAVCDRGVLTDSATSIRVTAVANQLVSADKITGDQYAAAKHC